MSLFKNTNYTIIHSALATLLVLTLVSCKNSSSLSSSNNNSPNSGPAHKNNNESTKASKVISTARSYLGTHYKYGGCSKKGIDCSGLTYTSFKSIDVELPRTAEEQSHKTKLVELKDLKPGDLVFFTDKKGHKKITHVGIVTEVKTSKKEIKFIHASTHAGVVEENLFAQWYLSIFIKGGRIF